MLPTHKSVRKEKAVYFLVLLAFIFSLGCFHEYYKVQTTSLNTFKETVNTGKIKQSDYFVLHHQLIAMHLSDIYFQDGNLYGVLSELPPYRYRDPRTYEKPVRYRPNEKYILEEVHLFLKDDEPVVLDTGAIAFSTSAIAGIHVYDKDNDATVASHVIGILGLSTPIVAGILLAQDMKSGWDWNVPKDPATGQPTSCPHVYANDGKAFRQQGEIFAAAIFPNLERHDYLALPDIRDIDGGYQIRITNVQQELQHINMTKLAVVEHPVNSTVLLDQTGNVQTITVPELPKRAKAPNGKNLLALIQEKDQQAYYYEEGEQLQNYVDLAFEKPEQTSTAKLLVNARSSYWSTLVFGAYTSRFGSDYDQWAAQMEEQPADKVYQMMDGQGLRMGVYLWSGSEWKLVERIENIGPLAFRDFVVPIDLSDHSGGEVRVKIEGGHLFWELDYAAMDFSDNKDVTYTEYEPGYAIASDNHIYTKVLAEDDKKYMHQTPGGNQVTIWYPAPAERPGYSRSIFLHSKGYYEHLRDYVGDPNLLNLPQLDVPGSLITFSKERYQQYLETNNLVE